jgi:hypothetical protein
VAERLANHRGKTLPLACILGRATRQVNARDTARDTARAAAQNAFDLQAINIASRASHIS